MHFHDISKDDSGEYTFAVEASKEEVSFLVDYAISSLLTKGLISIDEEQLPSQEIELGAGKESLN